jgi:predicted membrane channel-forming protein YqfA (hemolysin III family)
MTIGTIVIIILGVAYVVWSIYAIRDMFKSKFDRFEYNIITIFWIATQISILLLLVYSYLFTNWNTKLW